MELSWTIRPRSMRHRTMPGWDAKVVITSLAVNSFAVVGLENGQQPSKVQMGHRYFQLVKVSRQIDYRQYGYRKALLMYVTALSSVNPFKFDVPKACIRAVEL